MQGQWIPEIMYEEAEDGISSQIPFIQVPTNEKMPNTIFIFESRLTGEFEPGPNGEELPVTELELHQYADMITLRKRLPGIIYDQVRSALNLQPLSSIDESSSDVTKDKIIEGVVDIVSKKNK